MIQRIQIDEMLIHLEFPIIDSYWRAHSRYLELDLTVWEILDHELQGMTLNEK